MSWEDILNSQYVQQPDGSFSKRGSDSLSTPRGGLEASGYTKQANDPQQANTEAHTRRIYLPITPMRAPRMTLGDNKVRRKGYPARPVVRRYAEYCGAIRSCWPQGVDFPDANAWMIFYIPMPKSWSKKKKAAMRGKLHQQRPDYDNLAKGITDALYWNHPEGKDDSHVADARITKLWSDVGYIEIFLDALPSVESIKQAA